MDKKLAGLLGAVGALVAASPGQAAPLQPSTDSVLQASSYSALLRPVPNALGTLRAMDAQAESDAAQNGSIVQVEDRDHHHHHHQRVVRRRPPHHHHHHNNHDRSVFR